MIGRAIGPYQILAELGRGGMGEVYRARDTKLDRDVALKILPESFASDPDRLMRFEREAKTLASLNHPNIAAIYGIEDRAIVMELVEGRDLSEVIVGARGLQPPGVPGAQAPGLRTNVPLDEAIAIARQIAEALEAAHEAGIIHRDLKPANIKVRDDGTVKVLDFGLAKALSTEHSAPGTAPGAPSTEHSALTVTSPALTAMGLILGTAAYMSPEQARGRPVDRRADIWAFGVVLYEMLTGRAAFQGDDVSITLANVLKEDLKWDVLPAGLPASVLRLLRRCLEKDPRNRLSSIGDARLELQDALTRTAPEDRPLAAATTVPRWVMAGAVVLASVAGGVAWWLKPMPVSFDVVTRFEHVLPDGQRLQAGARVALSPDGTQIAYVASQQLYVRRLDQLDAFAVGRAVGRLSGPVFSADGRMLVYLTQAGQDRRSVLWAVAVGGGEPSTLATFEGRGGDLSAGPDGIVLVFRHDVEESYEVILVSLSDGSTRTLAAWEDRDRSISYPVLFDQGRKLVYSSRPASDEPPYVAIRDLGSGKETKLNVQGSDVRILPSGHVVYKSGVSLLAAPFDLERLVMTGPGVVVEEDLGPFYYDIASTGTMVFGVDTDESARTYSFVWVDRLGGETPINVPPRRYSYPRVSPDGSKIVVDQQDEDRDLWVWDVARETMAKLTFGRDEEAYPQWMPDGRHVVYRRLPASSRAVEIVRKTVDGAGAAEVIATTAGDGIEIGPPLSVSGDGRFLVHRSNVPYDIRLLLLDGSGVSQPLIAEPAIRETNGEVSPDGRWLAYEADNTGTTEVYVSPFPAVGEGRWQISFGGGRRPAWSRSGRELFFESTADRRLAVVPVPLIAAGAAFVGGKVQLLFDLSRYSDESNAGRAYDIGADGRVLLMKAIDSRATARQQSLVVVSHWFDELRAKVRVK